MAGNPRIKDWSGKRVWLLGASTGIGAALAEALAARGARLALSGRRAEALAALAIPGARCLPCDVTDAAALAAATAELRQTMRTLNDTLKTSQTAIEKTSHQLNATGVQARQTLATADAALKNVEAQTTLTLQSLQQLSDTTRGTVTQMQPALQQTLQETRLAAEGARRAMQDLAAVAAPGSPLRTDVNAAVSDLSQAARSLRSFADQVEREPNSLIFGGSKP